MCAIICPPEAIGRPKLRHDYSSIPLVLPYSPVHCEYAQAERRRASSYHRRKDPPHAIVEFKYGAETSSFVTWLHKSRSGSKCRY